MYTPRTQHLFLLLSTAILCGNHVVAQKSTPPSRDHVLNIDSTYLDNPGHAARVVFRKVVKFDGATWSRLFFDKTNLPEGSRLELTSIADKAVQKLDGNAIRDYGYSSCYFNGNAVQIELVAGPATKANRVLVVGATTGLGASAGPESICGNTDDRTQSTDKRQGRLSTGCTGWLIQSDVVVTAGHCIGSGTMILSFNVPDSTSTGVLVQSAPKDQYPVVSSTIRSLNTGVGADWAVARVGKNGSTGKLPGDAQGSWYSLGAVPGSTSGQNIRITGYGTTTPKNKLNQVQKTDLGPLLTIGSTHFRYHTDTTGGNSGSPVIHENTGKAIGIHTHGGCNAFSSSGNHGTRIDRADLTSAIRALMGKDGKFESYGTGCLGSNRQRPTLAGIGNPQIGRLSVISVKNLLPLRLGFFVFGTSNTKGKGGYPLPFNLSIIGMKDCFQYASASVYQPVISLPGGTTGFVGYIPRDQSMVDSTFYMQYFSDDPLANAFGTTSSNGLKVTIGG